VFHSVLADQLVKRGAARDARERGARERVCAVCCNDNDHIIGGIHSELPCMRCQRAPCAGVVVIARENL
jgi:hypothetical protein